MKINKMLLSIITLASILRFYQLGSLPALNADEAAIGYNAYTLLQTGLDEHGNPWPIHFQSFNDYKPGLYFYTVLPFVAVLGLDILAVRIPGAIFGVLAVWGIYLLTRIIFPKKQLEFGNRTLHLAEIAALLLAISPWHIHFSRGGWEVNMATTLIIFGLYFFIKSLRRSELLSISVILFVASLYTYHSARLIVPLLGVLLFIKYWRELLKDKRVFFGSSLFAIVLLIPLAVQMFGPAGLSRAGGVSIFSDRGPIDRINMKRGEHSSLASPQAKLVHNKYVEYALSFSENYLDHFWGEYLFLSGDDIQRNKVPEMGQLYLIQFPLIILGLFYISRNKKGWYPILVWLIVAPTAAAITFQSPHALRSQVMVVPLAIVSAYGLYVFLSKSRKVIKVSLLFAILLIVWSSARYVHQYYSHMAKTYSFSSQHGLEELVDYVANRQDSFEKIYVTTRYDQPYILFLFYSKYQPSLFQGNHTLTPRDEFNFSTVERFDKYEFGQLDWNELRDKRNILVAGTVDEIDDEGANVIKEIYFPNGDVAFKIVEL